MKKKTKHAAQIRVCYNLLLKNVRIYLNVYKLMLYFS